MVVGLNNDRDFFSGFGVSTLYSCVVDCVLLFSLCRFFPNNWYQSFWFDSGGGSSAMKFRLENVCNQGYTRSSWRGGDNTRDYVLKQQLCYGDAKALVEGGNRWSIESWTLEASITCV